MENIGHEPFREINNRINLFFRNLKNLNHPDFRSLTNDEFSFLGGRFKFVRTLSLAKRIGMVDVFYWKEDKKIYEMIEKFNLYFYEDAPCQIINYLPQGGFEKGALRKVEASSVHNTYLDHFFQMLVDREIAFNLIPED